MLLPDRVWALLTDEEQAHVREIVAGWKYQPVTNCPACGALLGFKVCITTSAVQLETPAQTPAAPRMPTWRTDLNDEEIAVLEEAETLGLFDAFTDAVQVEKAGQVPADLRRFLLTWLRSARETQVPRFVINHFKADWPSGFLRFYQAQGVIAVCLDGVLKAFVPKTRVDGFGIKARVPGGLSATLNAHPGFEAWVKGRFGYVPQGAPKFGEAMRQRNTGTFGRLVQ